MAYIYGEIFFDPATNTLTGQPETAIYMYSWINRTSDEYNFYGYAIMGSNDGTTWTKIKHFYEDNRSFSHVYDIETSGYSKIIVVRGYQHDSPGGYYWGYLKADDNYSETFNYETQRISTTLELSALPQTLNISVNSVDGIGSASSTTMDTQVVHSIQGIAEGLGSALSTTVELLDILNITTNSANGLGGTSGTIQVIQSVSRIISGVVNLSGTPTEGATVIAVEPTLLKSYKTTTVSDGTYEIYVNDVGTYHVLAVFEDGVGNKYGAMIQPYVAITE